MEYCIDCCVQSSCKINGIIPKCVDAEKVSEQVILTVPSSSRLTFAATIKWCSTDKSALQLFSTIDQTE